MLPAFLAPATADYHSSHHANSDPLRASGVIPSWPERSVRRSSVWCFSYQPPPQDWGAMLRNAMGDAPPLKKHKGRAGE